MKRKLITIILLAIVFLNIEIVGLNNYNNQIEVSNVLYMENNSTVTVSESKNEDIYVVKVVYCGTKENKIPAGLPKFTSNIVKIIQFLIPVALIIFGMYDFAMAVIASDEKKMKDASGKFVRRLIAGVLIFLVVAIVKLGFGLIKTDTNYLGCINCFVNNKCNNVVKTYACYQCNSDTGIYKWKTSIGSDSSCSAGYHKLNNIKTEEKCKSKDKSSNSTSNNSNSNSNNSSNNNSNNNSSNNSNSNAYACYQCSTDLTLYKWSNNIKPDSSCKVYNEIRDIKTKEDCHG